ncbi:cytochrome P450 [Geopyxis carbonaria]|nr:cytochrome P450 [Geopyxis carbonaria]
MAAESSMVNELLAMLAIKNLYPYLLALGALHFVGSALVALYRSYNDKLSHIPGPRLAAAGPWYEQYYDIVRGGAFIEKLEGLHKVYGHYVRVNPEEVHTSDPDAIGVIFAIGSNFTKAGAPAPSAHPIASKSILGMQNNKEHAHRRALVAPLFSKQAVQKLEWLLAEKIERMLQRYEQAVDTGRVLNISNSLRCMTLEAIDKFTYNGDISELDVADDEFDNPMFDIFASTSHTMHLVRHFPAMARFQLSLPNWLLTTVMPNFSTLLDYQKSCSTTVRAYKKDYAKASAAGHPTIIGRLLSPDAQKAGRELAVTDAVLRDECLVFLIAGTDPVARGVTYALWYLAQHPEAEARLAAELADAVPDRNVFGSWEQLERLPFLTAVIKETLRMNGSTPGKLIRVVPKGGVTINGNFFPEDTHLSMSFHILHQDETIFPDPKRFVPERWLGDGAKQLDPYMCAFSKGSKACLGIQVAWAQLYMTLGNIVRRYTLDVSPTTEYDMSWWEANGPVSRGSLKARLSARA